MTSKVFSSAARLLALLESFALVPYRHVTTLGGTKVFSSAARLLALLESFALVPYRHVTYYTGEVGSGLIV